MKDSIMTIILYVYLAANSVGIIVLLIHSVKQWVRGRFNKERDLMELRDDIRDAVFELRQFNRSKEEKGL